MLILNTWYSREQHLQFCCWSLVKWCSRQFQDIYNSKSLSFTLDPAYKESGYNKHPSTMSWFLCIKTLLKSLVITSFAHSKQDPVHLKSLTGVWHCNWLEIGQDISIVWPSDTKSSLFMWKNRNNSHPGQQYLAPTCFSPEKQMSLYLAELYWKFLNVNGYDNLPACDADIIHK